MINMGHKKTIDYWRHPTKREIKFGEGAIHWLTVDIEKVQKPDGIGNYLSQNILESVHFDKILSSYAINFIVKS